MCRRALCHARLEGGTLAIRQSLEETRSAGAPFKAPKTRKGQRVIDLSPSLMVALLKLTPNRRRKRSYWDRATAITI
jgi:hypothetical protein